MKKSKLLSILMILTMVIAMTGCSRKSQKKSDSPEPLSEKTMTAYQNGEALAGEVETHEDLPDATHVKALGRTYQGEDYLWFPLSASGAEFIFYGKSAQVVIYGDSTALKVGGSKDNRARYAVLVDEELVIDAQVEEIETTVTVVDSEDCAWHKVRILKLSEAGNSTMGIGKITTQSVGGIYPTENNAHYIEFIGDSITCGYGVDDEVKEHHFSTSTEDATKAYAYKTAALLGADYSLVSYSGHGIISGYSGGGEKTDQLMPPMYEKLAKTYSSFKGLDGKDMDWNFERPVDVVVINLGTNDASYTKNQTDRVEEFCTEYVEFLKQVRKCNPNAKIVCVLGTMGQDLYSAIEDAVGRYTDETGDTNVASLKLDNQSAADGIAADWHPSAKTHSKVAEKLAAFIEDLMGW